MIRCISMYEVGMEALTTPNSADDDAASRRLAFIIATGEGVDCSKVIVVKADLRITKELNVDICRILIYFFILQFLALFLLEQSMRILNDIYGY